MGSLNNKIVTTALNKQDLIEQLKYIGLNSDMVVEVHCALSQVGFIIGGAKTLLDAFTTVLENGTIVMPCQNYTNNEPLYWENPPIELSLVNKIRDNAINDNQNCDISHMGALAQTMRLNPNTVYSSHPNTAFMALGKQANELMAGQPLNFALGKGSPIDKIYHYDNSYILLIGTDYDKCTALHLAEYISGCRPIYLDGAAVKKDGKDVWTKYLECMIDSQDFNDIGKGLEQQGIAKNVKLGNAVCHFIKYRQAINYATLYLKKKYGGN